MKWIKRLHHWITQRTMAKMMFAIIILSAFSVTLAFIRMEYLQSIAFRFMVWNLFLAWIPLGVALLAYKIHRRKWSWVVILPLLGLWLFFLPNAPYLVTDLVHIGRKHGMLLWYDQVMLFSFAFTGMLITLVSLGKMHAVFHSWFGWGKAWFFVMATSVLTAVGVYLGRVERWNSWDLINHPKAILYDVGHIIMHPISNASVIVFWIMFTALILMAYVSFRYIIHLPFPEENNN